MKIALYDFDDSFTYNIAFYLKYFTPKLKVIHWRDYKKSFEDFDSIFLGPGPGHPLDYESLLDDLRSGIKIRQHNGICLGHQLLGLCHGLDIIQNKKPEHGISRKVKVPQWSCFSNKLKGKSSLVQVYNSLSLNGVSSIRDKSLNFDDEFMFLKTEQSLSYQFHPESVGTSFPMLFFEAFFRR